MASTDSGYYVRGHMKSLLYRIPLNPEQDLSQRIISAAHEMRILIKKKPSSENAFEDVFVIGDSISNRMCEIN